MLMCTRLLGLGKIESLILELYRTDYLVVDEDDDCQLLQTVMTSDNEAYC